MNENNRDMLKKILDKCEVKIETASFNGYLVPDNVLDLDKNEENDNVLAKFVIWVKSIPLAMDENEKQNQLLNIEKEIIAFTSSHSNGANSSIYVVEDDLKVFADYLKNKYSKFVVVTNIDSLLQKRVQVASQEPPVIQPNVNIETPKEEVPTNQPVEGPKPVSEVQPNMDNTPVTNEPVSQIEPSVVVDNEGPKYDTEVIQFSSNQEPTQPVNTNENMSTPNVGINPTPIIPENIVPHNDSSFNDGVDKSSNETKNNEVTSEKKDSRIGKLAQAGFVKFPIFLLTIMAIGAIGIFIGKMFYTFLSQQ